MTWKYQNSILYSFMKNKEAKSRLGLYHSQSSDQMCKIREKIEANEKPWKVGHRPHILYNWDSSIPRKWIDIKGKSNFRHMSQLKDSRQTEHFLAETHSYISNICQNEKTEPKVIIPKTNFYHVEESPDIQHSPSEYSHDALPLTKPGFPVRVTRKFPQLRHERFQTTDPLLASCCSIMNLRDSPNNTFFESVTDSVAKEPRKYLVNSFALPNKITGYLKISPESENIQKVKNLNREVDDFLNRFKIKQESQLPSHIKTGLIGSKLSTVKFPSLDKKKHYRHISYDVMSHEKSACDITNMSFDH